MSHRESQPPPVGPARRVAFTAGTESLARPLDPGHELTIDNASGGPIWVRAGRGWADGGGPAEIERLRAEVAALRADLEDAAGELRVSILDAPVGSVAAKLLAANAIMRRQRDAALLGRSRADSRLGTLVGVAEGLADWLDRERARKGRLSASDADAGYMVAALREALAEARAEDTPS